MTMLYLLLCIYNNMYVIIIYSLLYICLYKTSLLLHIMPEQSLSNTHIFSLRHTRAFLNLGMLDNPPTLCWEPFSTVKIPSKSTKYMGKNLGINRPWSTHLFTVCGLRPKLRAWSCGLSWVCVCGVAQMHHAMCVLETMNFDLWVRN